MTTSERIKKAREAKGMSQQELADKLGYKSRSSINKLEKEGRDIPRSQIVKLAEILDVTPAYLMCWDEEGNISTLENARPLPPVLSCDYYHSVSAGIGIGAEKHSEKYNYWFTSQSQADRCFAVDVEGDSMEPELHDGDVAIVDTDEEPQNDDIVVMYDKADELGYIKRYRMTDNCVMFISLNPAYDTMVFPLTDFTDRIVIHGKVIAVNRKY